MGIASTIGVVQLMRKVVHRKKSEGERICILYKMNNGIPKRARSNSTLKHSKEIAKWQYALTANDFNLSFIFRVAKDLGALRLLRGSITSGRDEQNENDSFEFLNFYFLPLYDIVTVNLSSISIAILPD